MGAKQVIRVLPDGEQETVLATELKVGDKFVDEARKQEGIVAEIINGKIKYRLPDGSFAVDDTSKVA